ncbi:uncharacterized protein YjbI with pentapeptide repeats [Rhizobium herbae]|uniref:Uncharacterized protein YjbI with pentapeptide repeats n=2 Tax=Rhizobium herbae TaxID=508661 RepID=A0ABS4EIP6_9HYPH|nr:uncharacterized protein YjbI with pentapeptide repeats [Rhizobium herbae]
MKIHFDKQAGQSAPGEGTAARSRALAFGLLPAMALAAVVAAASPAKAAYCSGTPEKGLDWSECSKKNLMLPSSELESANLSGTDFSLTDLSGSNLVSANLEKANLVRAWLAGAKADKANFARVEAYRSSFANIAATGASFAGAELQRADFSGADLTGANFEKAEVGRVLFKGAVLTGARFSLANLSRANLSGAIFEGPLVFDQAFMFLTHIEGLDLSAAKGLEQSQIELACGDAKTKLPAGLTTPSAWPCKLD